MQGRYRNLPPLPDIEWYQVVYLLGVVKFARVEKSRENDPWDYFHPIDIDSGHGDDPPPVDARVRGAACIRR
jgi:hypothetical protein